MIVRDPLQISANQMALFVCVFSVDQQNDLERQRVQLKVYLAAQRFQVTRMVSVIDSGSNERRPKLHVTPDRSRDWRERCGAGHAPGGLMMELKKM